MENLVHNRSARMGTHALSLSRVYAYCVSNTLAEFPANQFRILAACNACRHAAWLNLAQIPGEITIDALRLRLTCQKCGSRQCGIRIVYTGAGEFEYRR